MLHMQLSLKLRPLAIKRNSGKKVSGECRIAIEIVSLAVVPDCDCRTVVDFAHPVLPLTSEH